MTFIYWVFFILAQLGGFYALLLLIAGCFVKPAAAKCFEHECVNSIHMANKVELAKIRAEAERRYNSAGLQDPDLPINLNEMNNLGKAPKDQRPLLQEEFK